MKERKTKAPGIPKFASEQDEAKWWATSEGRSFVSEQSARKSEKATGGSKLVTKLGSAGTVQIALRLSSPDLAKARQIAERKGIGYQTLLKMIVHEGLQRVERQA